MAERALAKCATVAHLGPLLVNDLAIELAECIVEAVDDGVDSLVDLFRNFVQPLYDYFLYRCYHFVIPAGIYSFRRVGDNAGCRRHISVLHQSVAYSKSVAYSR